MPATSNPQDIVPLIVTYQPVLTLVVTLLAGTGLVTLVKLPWEKNNRSVDVLFKLEELYKSPECHSGKNFIEDQAQYDRAKSMLRGAVVDDPAVGAHSEGRDDIDHFLRFYVVLLGIKQARQVPEAVLSTCFRFRLAHYYREDREEFREYINRFFPTLREWLLTETSWTRRLYHRPFSTWWRRSFFTPEAFWPGKILTKRSDLYPTKEGNIVRIS